MSRSSEREKSQQHCPQEKPHIPMWRLSRLQNLAISPLATILLFKHGQQDEGVTREAVLSSW